MILRTLGGLSLEGASFRRPKPLLLLAYLALEGHAERRHLAELFWMEAANARRSLSTALSQLRKGAPGAIDSDEVRAWSEVTSDAALLLRAIEKRDWLAAIELYRGPFLEGFDDVGQGIELEEWIHGTREALADSVRRAYLALAEAAAREADFGDAGRWADRARALDHTAPPEPDDLARTYRLLVASGRTGLHAMRQEGEALGLALAPSREAARRSLSGPPHASTGTVSPSALPSRTTSFVGRREELVRLSSMVRAEDTRLLSIVGSGGTGKTRLALRLATEQERAGGWSGVHFVALEGLRDADQVAGAIGDHLGLDLPEGDDPEASLHQLRTAIGHRPRLIVLDSFEHLLPAGPLLSELVRTCPRLHLVVTSRARLDLAEERAVVLGGLPFPGSRSSEPADEGSRTALAYDAVRLFVQRARRARADFAPGEDDLDSVVRICAAVGGVPLALEMASAWLRVMSCADIADELERGIDLLESRDRDRPHRHRSMRVTFEQSWRLLSRDDQRLATAMSAFRGGFGRAAASSVAAASLAQLASLVDRSLLSWDGAGRYHLHPLLQRFLEEKAQLDPERAADVLERHARHYLDVLETLRRSFLARPRGRDATGSRDAGRMTAAIEVDLANILAAWRWASRHGRNAWLENAVEPLGWYFLLRGRPLQGLAWNEVALSADAESLLSLRHLLWRAESLKELGRLPEAMDCIQRAIRLAERRDARPELAHALRLAGFTYLRYDPPDKARVVTAYRRSLALYRALGDAWGEALMLGNLAYELDDPDITLSMVREGLELARASAETLASAMNLGYLAKLLAYCRGEYDAARAAAEEGIACHEVAGFEFHLAHTLLTLGDIHLARGEMAAAEAVGDRALAMCTAFQGDAEAMVRGGTYTLLGHVGRLQDASERATARYHQALGLLRQQGRNETTVWAAGMSLDGLARIALTEGRPEQARAHADEALALLRRYAVHGMLFLPAAIDLACLVRLGEARTLEGELDRAEAHLLDALSRARARKRIPAALEALAALAELRRRQGDADEATELLAVVAGHGASPFWLVRHAERSLDVPSRPGGRAGVSLADALSFVLDGVRSP